MNITIIAETSGNQLHSVTSQLAGAGWFIGWNNHTVVPWRSR